MKEAFRETWKLRLLSLLKNSENKAILQILNMLEDDGGGIVDVEGNTRFWNIVIQTFLIIIVWVEG